MTSSNRIEPNFTSLFPYVNLLCRKDFSNRFTYNFRVSLLFNKMLSSPTDKPYKRHRLANAFKIKNNNSFPKNYPKNLPSRNSPTLTWWPGSATVIMFPLRALFTFLGGAVFEIMACSHLRTAGDPTRNYVNKFDNCSLWWKLEKVMHCLVLMIKQQIIFQALWNSFVHTIIIIQTWNMRTIEKPSQFWKLQLCELHNIVRKTSRKSESLIIPLALLELSQCISSNCALRRGAISANPGRWGICLPKWARMRKNGKNFITIE